MFNVKVDEASCKAATLSLIGAKSNAELLKWAKANNIRRNTWLALYHAAIDLEYDELCVTQNTKECIISQSISQELDWDIQQAQAVGVTMLKLRRGKYSVYQASVGFFSVYRSSEGWHRSGNREVFANHYAAANNKIFKFWNP